jgi:hypothetical protein
MHREDNSNYLLFIEPSISDKLKIPINDELTELMDMALSNSKYGSSRYSDLNDVGTFYESDAWRGRHATQCGVDSTNKDYLLENGMITNSLATFYLKWYRYSIPEIDMKKIYKLKEYYINKKL